MGKFIYLFAAQLLGVCFLLGSRGNDRTFVQVTPAEVGMSEEKLRRISDYLQSEIDDGVVTAAVGMVARHGRISYFEAFGESQKDSLFRLASMTKAVTTVAVMQLVEEGSVRLEDPIDKHLPAFKDLQVIDSDGNLSDAASVPTIHQLLTHTSGIG